MRTNGLALALLLGAAACAAPASDAAVDTAADEEAIRALTPAYDAAWKARDAVALANLYAEDAVLMNANIPARVGREAIRAGYATELAEANGLSGVEGEVSEVHVSGDLAVVRGTWKATVTPNDGSQPYQNRGSWVTNVGRQADGSWKTVWEMSNSELPPRTPNTAADEDAIRALIRGWDEVSNAQDAEALAELLRRGRRSDECERARVGGAGGDSSQLCRRVFGGRCSGGRPDRRPPYFRRSRCRAWILEGDVLAQGWQRVLRGTRQLRHDSATPAGWLLEDHLGRLE